MEYDSIAPVILCSTMKMLKLQPSIAGGNKLLTQCLPFSLLPELLVRLNSRIMNVVYGSIDQGL